MQLKTVHARNIEEALRQIRTIYGEEAIIVAQAEDADGVHITAVLDKPDIRQKTDSHLKLVQQFDTPVDAVGEAFDRHGVPRRLGDAIIDEMETLELDDPLAALTAIFDKRFTFHPVRHTATAKPIILVGPPGAGKTLLTAKIATQHKLQNQDVNVITTDTIKAGGAEQLQGYTDVLKTPLHRVRGARELEKLLPTLNLRLPTIIDTVGVNPFLGNDLINLSQLIAAAHAEPVMVLSGGLDADEAGSIAHRFHDLGVSRFMFTRLDMTRKFGSMLVIAHKGNLSFSHVSISPMVADGFHALSAPVLARLFLETASFIPHTQPENTP